MYTSISPRDRRNLLPRLRHAFNKRCAYCGKHLKPGEETIDHIRPLSLGGTDEWDNLALSCRKCNGSKSSKELAPWTIKQIKGKRDGRDAYWQENQARC